MTIDTTGLMEKSSTLICVKLRSPKGYQASRVAITQSSKANTKVQRCK